MNINDAECERFSDEKRRKIAKNLREHFKNMRANDFFKKDTDQWVCGNITYRIIAGCVDLQSNLEQGRYAHIVRVLADLIDRPTCHDTGERVDRFTCSSCGFREGIIIFNPFTYSFREINPDWKYCPNCGREVDDEASNE